MVLPYFQHIVFPCLPLPPTLIVPLKSSKTNTLFPCLTLQPTPTVLERVRRVKNTLVRQTQVIAQLKGVLEALLDDDRDM
jgi:hypothetical protein